MTTQSIGRLFIKAGVQVALCLALAGLTGYLLMMELAANTTPLSALALFYSGLAGLTAIGIGVAVFRLYRAVRAALDNDIQSLARMFQDVRAEEVREHYPLELREFNEIFLYLRDSSSKLVQEKAELKDLGLIDHLSQLSNRRHFERRLRRLFDANKSRGTSSVLIIDVDYFKSVNDQHGHDAGDALIVNFSKALRACVRESDFLARLGGDEFCIVYPYMPVEKAAQFVERLRQQLPREVMLTHGVVHSLRWTGGLSAISDDDTQFDEVLWRADKALLYAKEAGRNNTKVYHPAKGLERHSLMLAS
ncbi:MAG: GGDEF domain-containing protein [Gammaproteobacteria bacterium]|nr:GGDEF domain-containing protein [Gammaproteobacteria bacterium]